MVEGPPRIHEFCEASTAALDLNFVLDADQMAERTQQALRTLEEKAHNLAKLVEALIYQAEHPTG